MKKVNNPDAARARILLAALPDIPFDGFTAEVLDRAAGKCRVSLETAANLFPRGPLDLALFFPAWADAEMLKRLPKKKLEDLRVRDRVTLGVRTRLEILSPHKQVLSSSLSFLALPPRNIHLPKIVWATADKIWRAAGDTATDYNHYTKRILLAGVLTSTTLFWLNDKSAGSSQTWEFLDRRIGEVLKIGRKIGEAAGKFKKKDARA